MTTKRMVIISLLSVISLIITNWVHAENTKSSMDQTYKALRQLQPYLVSPEKFESQENSPVIQKSLKSLQENFHTLDSLPSKFQDQPGFNANILIINDLLSDSLYRFNEGKKSYALWRLRTISNHCTSCHATYNPSLRYEDAVPLKSLTDIEQGEFYLATRQFTKAETAFVRALSHPEDVPSPIELLRKWLMIETRMKNSPQQALESLLNIVKALQLPIDDQEEIAQWILSLKKWSNEQPDTEDPLIKAEQLTRSSIGREDKLFAPVDAVNLLRATAILHNLLIDAKAFSPMRSRALYLLGASYYKLPFFFINELPEIYLEQCIREYPGTTDAKEAYRVYKEKVTLDFTGSRGTHLPGDITAKLTELYNKAYGIPPFEGRVQIRTEHPPICLTGR